ncbi:MAG: helix-turn-helix domain-containing protein, partial [Bacilli bacterium]
MIFMYRAYKFRLYPNNNQLELINKFFGCNRFVYNYYLDKIKKDKYMS